METYTAKEAKNRLGEVLRAALRHPVVITVHGKPSVQLTSVESTPPLSPPNAQDKLDRLKHRLSCAVLANFPLEAIKRHSLANIERWRGTGVSGPAYEAWEAIILDSDEMAMIKAMVGLDERSNELRQSIPYVGMLPQSMVEELNAEISR
ncbi:type II toxin-antitoxin system prevent-host-death family antitoxin [Massilia sp. R2A-15]|uniref:type II toxin-antitoxin system Phd/YefM family antitoxin n=1 Tax=Massilia sp. R2A-15 TaxID=3064278 RepID=UPI002733C467|nr:type II toxin-antitoxin system prevent-host-death family antitoxin [Massilia sp. R2A-15]WLI90500.1 type II toxin-antitoxin system prevent-host-death family antitoxin [Massilia sp. R2A-15]